MLLAYYIQFFSLLLIIDLFIYIFKKYVRLTCTDSHCIITYNVFFRLMDIAKEMTRESLPIKCLEAVILGMYPSLELDLKCDIYIYFFFIPLYI